MNEWRDAEILRRREGAEQLDAALTQWKQEVLDELDDEGHMMEEERIPMNLQRLNLQRLNLQTEEEKNAVLARIVGENL